MNDTVPAAREPPARAVQGGDTVWVGTEPCTMLLEARTSEDAATTCSTDGRVEMDTRTRIIRETSVETKS